VSRDRFEEVTFEQHPNGMVTQHGQHPFKAGIVDAPKPFRCPACGEPSAKCECDEAEEEFVTRSGGWRKESEKGEKL
jgi:hypothetical protein